MSAKGQKPPAPCVQCPPGTSAQTVGTHDPKRHPPYCEHKARHHTTIPATTVAQTIRITTNKWMEPSVQHELCMKSPGGHGEAIMHSHTRACKLLGNQRQPAGQRCQLQIRRGLT